MAQQNIEELSNPTAPFKGNFQNWTDEDMQNQLDYGTALDSDSLAQQAHEFSKLEENPAMQAHYSKYLEKYNARMQDTGLEPLHFLKKDTEKKVENEQHQNRIDYAPMDIAVANGTHENLQGLDPKLRAQTATTYLLNNHTDWGRDEINRDINRAMNIYGKQVLKLEGDITFERFNAEFAKGLQADLDVEAHRDDAIKTASDNFFKGGTSADIGFQDDPEANRIARDYHSFLQSEFRGEKWNTAKEISDVLKAIELDGENTPENRDRLDKAAVKLSNMNLDDTEKVVYLLGKMGELEGEHVEGFWKKAGKNLGRAVESLAINHAIGDQTIDAALDRDMRLRGDTAVGRLQESFAKAQADIEAGNPVELGDLDEGLQRMLGSKYDEQGVRLGSVFFGDELGSSVDALVSGESSRKIAAEELEAIKDRVSGAGNINEVKKRIFDAKGSIARIDANMDNKWNNWVGRAANDIENAIYTVPGSIPMSLASVVATPLAFSSYFGETYQEGRDEGLSHDQSFKTSMMSSAPKVYLNRLATKAATWQSKRLNKFLDKIPSPKIRGGLKFGAGVGVEFAEERLQDSLDEWSQSLLKAVGDEDMPELSKARLEAMVTLDPRSWWDKETFLASLAFGLAGAGPGAITDMVKNTDMKAERSQGYRGASDAEAKRVLKSKNTMKSMGHSEQTAEEVSQAANEGNWVKAGMIYEAAEKKLSVKEVKERVIEAHKDGTAKKAQVEAIASDPEYKEHNEELKQAGMPYVVPPTTPEGKFQIIQEGEPVVEVDMEDVPAALFKAESLHADEMYAMRSENVQKMVKFLQENMEGVEANIDEEARLFSEEYEDGIITYDQMMDRVNAYEKANGLKVTDRSDKAKGVARGKNFTVHGRNKLRQEDMKIVMDLFKSADAHTVIEEGAEGYIKRQIEEGAITEDWLKAKMLEYQSNAGGNVIDGNSEFNSVLEYFSDVAQAYIMGDVGNEQVPDGLRQILSAILQKFSHLMKMAADLVRMKSEGVLDADLENLLASSVGLRPGQRYEAESMKADAEVDQTIEEAIAPDEKAAMDKAAAEREAGADDFDFSITPAQDAEYMEAVKSGDMDLAQSMVDAAAKAAGYVNPALGFGKLKHITSAKFDEFIMGGFNSKVSGKAVWLSPVGEAGHRAHHNVKKGEEIQMDLYARTLNPLMMDDDLMKDFARSVYASNKESFPHLISDDTLERVKSEHDSIIWKDDEGVEVIVFDPNQIKSSDPVTYDSEGNVIPLSQRFDEGKDSINYSIEPKDAGTESGTLVETDTDVADIDPNKDGEKIEWEYKKANYSIAPRFLPEVFPELTEEMFNQVASETSTTAAIHIDRMKVGELDGVPLQGGMFYPSIVENLNERVAWAFNSEGVARTVANRAAQNGGYVKLVLMQEGNVVGNKTFSKIWFTRLRKSIADKKISKTKALKILNDQRKLKAESTGHTKSWKTIDEAEKQITDMAQTKEPPTISKKSLTTTKSEGEKISYGFLLSKKNTAQGLPDAIEIVSSIEEESFKGLPTGAIVGLIKIDEIEEGSKIQTADEVGVPEHLSYKYVLKGNPVARMSKITVLDEVKPEIKGQILSQQHTDFDLAEVLNYSIEALSDAEYMAAVKSGDMDLAQSMVDAAAKRAGYEVEGFHGKSGEIPEVFKPTNDGVNTSWESRPATFFAVKHDFAKMFADHSSDRTGDEATVFRAYLKTGESVEKFSTDEAVEDLKARGVSSTILKDIESGELLEYAVFDSNQIKSADPITYDSEGNVIPLSQRFDEGKDSINYSIEAHKLKQLEVILRENPATDDYHTWVREVSDIKTFHESLEHSDYKEYFEEGDDFDPSYSNDMARDALDSGRITVYSSYPIDQGIFVTPSYAEASEYAGHGEVHSKEVNLEDVAWIDPTQGQYAVVNGTNFSIAPNEEGITLDDMINQFTIQASKNKSEIYHKMQGRVQDIMMRQNAFMAGKYVPVEVEEFDLEGFTPEEVKGLEDYDLTEVDPLDVRSSKSLRKEAAMLQALRREELENEIHESTHGMALSAEEFTKLKNQPVHEYLADPDSPMRGALMSESQALKTTYLDPILHGDYDGSSGVSRSVFGGTVMPDVAAQELYNNGLISEPTTDALWQALERELQSTENIKVAVKQAKKAMRDARKQAKDEADTWLAQAIEDRDGEIDAHKKAKKEASRKNRQNKIKVDKANARKKAAVGRRNARQKEKIGKRNALKLAKNIATANKRNAVNIERRRMQDTIRDLARLDAMLKVMPAGVRARVGGFTQVAKIGNAEGREAELKRRLAKMDQYLEKEMAEDYRGKLKKEVKRGQLKKGKNEKVAKGKITAEHHDELNKIEDVLGMDKEALDEARDKALAELDVASNSEDKGNRDDLVAEAEKDVARLTIFGGIYHKTDPRSSEDIGNALIEVTELINTGRMLNQLKIEQRKSHVQDLRRMVKDVVSGGKGRVTSVERLKDVEKTARNFLKKEHARNLSFEMLMNVLSRKDKTSGSFQSKMSEYFSPMVHNAAHGESRAVVAKEKEMVEFLADVFGYEMRGSWEARVEEKIVDQAAMTINSKVFREENAQTKKITVTRDEAEQLRSGGIEWVHNNEYGFVQLNKSEIEQVRGLLLEDDNKTKGQPKKKFTIDRKIDGEMVEQYLSQDTATFLTMMYKQDGLKPAMEAHGYTEEVMEQMEEFMTEETKQIREWLFSRYDENYDYFNEMFVEMFGHNLPKVENYSPARSVHAGRQATEMIDSEKTKQSTTPGMGMERINHKAEPRNDVGALQLYKRHLDATEHFVHWAKPVSELRSVFMDKDVREMIYDHHGREAYEALIDKIDYLADGGNVDAVSIRAADHFRKAFTIAKLSLNWGVLLKQLTSLPAYMFDMTASDFARHEFKFWMNPIKNTKMMMATDYVKHRWGEGYDRDVMLVMDRLQKKRGKAARAAEWGMIFGRVGDIIPVIIGGYAAYRNGYEKAIERNPNITEKQAEAAGILQFEMSTDRAQQSGNTKDQSYYAMQGSMARVLTMFTTSPRQYYSVTSEMVLDAMAGRQDGTRKAVRAVIIGHVVLPSLFYWVSAFTRNLPKDEEDREEIDDLVGGWLASMAMGGANGLFLWGQGISTMMSGYEYTPPVVEWFDHIGKGTRKTKKEIAKMFDEEAESVKPEDIISALDHYARAFSLAKGGGALWYDISTRFSKSVGFDEETMQETLLMSNAEVAVKDIRKTYSKIKEEFPAPKALSKRDKERVYKTRYIELAMELKLLRTKYPDSWDVIKSELDEKNIVPNAVLKKVN